MRTDMKDSEEEQQQQAAATSSKRQQGGGILLKLLLLAVVLAFCILVATIASSHQTSGKHSSSAPTRMHITQSYYLHAHLPDISLHLRLGARRPLVVAAHARAAQDLARRRLAAAQDPSRIYRAAARSARSAR